MPNGTLTTKQYLIKIDQKLDDFLDAYDVYKEDHKGEHKIIWKLLIGLPSFLLVVFTLVLTLIKVFGGKV